MARSGVFRTNGSVCKHETANKQFSFQERRVFNGGADVTVANRLTQLTFTLLKLLACLSLVLN